MYLRRGACFLCFFFFLLGFTGCELEEFSEDVREEDEQLMFPVGHGKGSQRYPYTVLDLSKLNVYPDTAVCVMGYAVGSTYQTMKNAVFCVPTTYGRNILLSMDSTCMHTEHCLPIELSTTASQNKFSLRDRPERYRQVIVVRGMVANYLGRIGLRKINSGYWLPNFAVDSISPSPAYWETYEKEY